MKEKVSFHDAISRNKWQSFFLMSFIMIVLILVGAAIGLAMGPDYFFIILIVSIIISILYIVIGYYNSDKIAIASVGAKKASQTHYRQYHNLVEGIALASGLPKPKLYVMESPQINAFASGRDPQHAVVCVTTGALEKLDKQELEGVLAHELSHIANYDIRFMTLTAVLVGMIAIVSEIFLRSLFWGSISGGRRDRDGKDQIIMIVIAIALAILAPILVKLVQLAISRKREYSADATAVKFTRSPTGLKNALKKIKHEHAPSKKQQKATKAMAPLFISDPFKRGIKGLFSTHPPIDKRIAILERM